MSDGESASAMLTAAFAALESLPHTVGFAVDADLSVVAWSQGAARVMALEREEMLGTHCRRGIRSPDCLGRCALEMASPGDTKRIELVVPGQGTRWYRRELFPVRDEQGAFLGGIEVLYPADGAGATAEDAIRRGHLVGQDEALRSTVRLARTLATTTLPIHIVGEVGTPRLDLARLVAEESDGGQPFRWMHGAEVAPEHLLGEGPSEPGTLYIEDVARTDHEVQAVLASRLHSLEATPSLPRIVTSTTRDLDAELRAGRILPELRIALGSATVTLPPLRERVDDLDDLVHHVLRELADGAEHRVTAVEPAAMDTLCRYRWPGNDAELRAVLRYAHQLAPGPHLRRSDLLPALQEQVESPLAITDRSDDERSEAEAVRRALQEASGDLARAAALLGVSRSTLWRRRKKYGLL